MNEKTTGKSVYPKHFKAQDLTSDSVSLNFKGDCLYDRKTDIYD